MVEPGFEGVFQLFGGLGVVAFRLHVDGGAEVQDHFGLFGGLHRELTGAAHERLQAAFCLHGVGIVGGVFEENFCQAGERLLASFSHRVEFGIGFGLALIQLFDLRHGDGTRPAFGAQGFGEQLSRAEKRLRLFCIGAVGQDLQGFVDQFVGLIHVAGALDKAGNRHVFRHRLGFVSEFFVR